MNAIRLFRNVVRFHRSGGDGGSSIRNTTTHHHNKSMALFSQIYPTLTTHQYPTLQLVRYMSKYVSKSQKKNLPLTTKRARKGFYKGKGCTTEGRINSTARFIVNPLKRLQLVVPELTGFRLKPYIASTASRFPPEERHNAVPA
jgi:Mitochondrial ribosomal protein L27